MGFYRKYYVSVKFSQSYDAWFTYCCFKCSSIPLLREPISLIKQAECMCNTQSPTFQKYNNVVWQQGPLVNSEWMYST